MQRLLKALHIVTADGYGRLSADQRPAMARLESKVAKVLTFTPIKLCR